jgi:hypothetical protein
MIFFSQLAEWRIANPVILKLYVKMYERERKREREREREREIEKGDNFSSVCHYIKCASGCS